MSFKYKILLTVTPLVFILDQFTKWLVIKNIPYNGSIPIISGYVDLVFFRNPGAAFGMFAGMGESFRNFFFFIVAIIAVVFLAVFFAGLKEKARMLPIAITLIFGGIAGNILDRIRFGEVTDFLSIHIQDVVINWTIAKWRLHIPLDWPAFNVADSAITVAMFMLVITAFRSDRGEG